MAGIGEALRSTRERRGLSIDQVAQDTRISPRFLEALEAEQFNELPAPVYVRGFLRSYANYLHIEAQPLLDRLIGGDMAAPGAATGYAGTNGRNGHTNGNGNGKSPAKRTDPFQRGGVMAAGGCGVTRDRATGGVAAITPARWNGSFRCAGDFPLLWPFRPLPRT